jgi:hypothetical protein
MSTNRATNAGYFPEMSENVQDAIQKYSIRGDLASLRQDPRIGDEDFIHFVRNMMTPVQFQSKWVGQERKVDMKYQIAVAQTLNADTEATRTVTKLYDFNNDRWKKIKAIRNKAHDLWTRMSIDYPPQDGIRLIRRELIEEFRTQFDQLRVDLREAAIELNEQFEDIIAEAKARRGVAFKREDYPVHLLDSFDISYRFPSVECAAEIRTLNPQLWMSECAKLRENLDEALHHAESVYLGKMEEMVQTLIDKLSPNADGSKKVFRDSAVDNIIEFIDEFRKTSIGAGERVQELVKQLSAITENTTPNALRHSKETARRIAEQLEKLNTNIKQVQLVEEQERLERINARKVRPAFEIDPEGLKDTPLRTPLTQTHGTAAPVRQTSHTT